MQKLFDMQKNKQKQSVLPPIFCVTIVPLLFCYAIFPENAIFFWNNYLIVHAKPNDW